jgi:hypothetical protein
MIIKVNRYYINLATLAYIVRNVDIENQRTYALVFSNGVELTLNEEDSAEFERILFSLDAARFQNIQKLFNQRSN